MPKMHAICNPQHCITYPELANRDLLDVMKRCLDRDPKARITLEVRGKPGNNSDASALQSVLTASAPQHTHCHKAASCWQLQTLHCGTHCVAYVFASNCVVNFSAVCLVHRSCWTTPSCTPTG